MTGLCQIADGSDDSALWEMQPNRWRERSIRAAMGELCISDEANQPYRPYQWIGPITSSAFHHRDPFARLLKLDGCTIITGDSAFAA
jgi:hypothetical protein